MSHVTGDKLLDDLKQVMRDAEELVKAVGGQAGQGTEEIRARAEEALQEIRARLAAIKDGAASRANSAAASADAQLRNNPWAAIGIAAAVGLLAGLLLGWRGGDHRD
jgi:ElaB/YqjD/DUF883 family membrane-anchored ribosome-binding protein